MAQGNFLDQFQASMDRLNESRRRIQAGVQMNNEFTNLLRDRLSQINNRLREFAGQIQTLKDTADNLQQQVNTHTASIGDRERQIEELNQNVAQSQQDRDNTIARINQEKQQLEGQVRQQQQQIDANEQQLRQLNANLQTVTDQKTALENELRNRGDAAQNHANEINRLTQESQQREQELTNRINECENRIQGFEQQIRDKDAEIARANEDHNATRGNAENQTQALQQQIAQLRQQNEQLVQRIVQATAAITEAADQLDDFSRGITQARSEQDLNQMLGDIEQSLELIGRAIQGQHAAAPNAAAARLPSNTPIEILDPSTGRSVNIPLNVIMTQLNEKASQLRRGNPRQENKYQISGANDMESEPLRQPHNFFLQMRL